MTMHCSKCSIDLDKNRDLFGDLTDNYDFICLNCLNPWYCYILDSGVNGKTYNGKTNDFVRRLKQHNGILSGGAKATRSMRPNKLIVLISGFSSNKEALRAEWRIKHPMKKKRRNIKFCKIEGRIQSLNVIFKDHKFTNNSEQPINLMNLTITILQKYAHLLDKSIPARIIPVDNFF